MIVVLKFNSCLLPIFKNIDEDKICLVSLTEKIIYIEYLAWFTSQKFYVSFYRKELKFPLSMEKTLPEIEQGAHLIKIRQLFTDLNTWSTGWMLH